MKSKLVPKAKDTTLTIRSRTGLQELIKLLTAFDNSTVDFPLKVGFSSAKRAWFARTGQRLWYFIKGQLEVGE